MIHWCGTEAVQDPMTAASPPQDDTELSAGHSWCHFPAGQLILTQVCLCLIVITKESCVAL